MLLGYCWKVNVNRMYYILKCQRLFTANKSEFVQATTKSGRGWLNKTIHGITQGIIRYFSLQIKIPCTKI